MISVPKQIEMDVQRFYFDFYFGVDGARRRPTCPRFD